MIHDLKPYPAYRDSGVPWVEYVPRHWEVQRARYLFREIDQRSQAGAEAHLSMSQKLGLVPSSMVEQRTLVSESYAGGKLCEENDLILNRLKAHLGVFALAKQAGVISPDYTVLRCVRPLEVRYFEYILRSPECRCELRVRAKGIVEGFWRLYTDDFYDIKLPNPPRAEQSTIVRFLNHMDRHIRRYIRAKQKLIALLNEQKQAIIHRAVTRGLDPNVRKKPSGVEWLGEVPEHWNELLLGRCLQRIDQGWSPTAAEGEISPDQWAVLTLSSVKRGVFDAAATKPVPITAKVPAHIEIGEGDLLLTRANTRELVGDVCVVQDPRPKTIICDLIYRLVANPLVFECRFLMYQLLSPLCRRQIERDARGSSGTMPKITHRHIRSWRVVAPSLDEQRYIVEALDDSLTSLENAAQRAEKEIFLLREYRTRLIADVVTGKLDVREVAAGLPDEAEESEPLDDIDAQVEGDEEAEGGDSDAESAEAEA